jgi:hypothetical protein
MFRLIQLFILTGITLFPSFCVFSQGRWVRSYFEGEDAPVICIDESYDNGYLFIGKYGANYSKYNWLLKTDINGEILWQKTIGNGINSIALHDCAIDEPGNIYLGGSTKAYDPKGDPLILKLNACGEKEWCRVFLTENNQDFCRCLTLTPQGDIVTVLLLTNPIPYTDRICLAKLTPAGELTWKKCYTSADTSQRNEDAYDILLTPDHGFLISGFCYYEDPVIQNRWWLKPYFLKIDSLGDFEWETVLYKDSTLESGIAWTTVISPDNSSFYSSITHYHNELNQRSPALVKLDQNGQLIDTYDIVEGYKYGKLYHSKFITDSTLAGSAGWGNTDDSVGYRAVIIDTLGNLIDSKEIIPDLYSSILQIVSNNKLLYASNQLINDQFDFYLAKLNQNLEDDTIYTQPFTYDSLCPYQIVSDTIVQDDCGLIVGIEEEDRTVGREDGKTVSLVVYPNPVREVLSVKVLGLSEGIVYSLEIYDVFGRPVLSSPRLGGGREGGFTVDVSALSPGIYLAVVRDKNHFIGSAKFVVVRY